MILAVCLSIFAAGCQPQSKNEANQPPLSETNEANGHVNSDQTGSDVEVEVSQQDLAGLKADIEAMQFEDLGVPKSN